MRHLTIVAVFAGIAAGTATAGAAATNQSTVAGGCQVQANAALTPGLTLSVHPFRYSYTGALRRCFYTGTGAAGGGVISAGEPITIAGRAYQEPVPAGTGTCAATSTKGYDFARWSNGTQTIVRFTTSSENGVTHLSGSVVDSLQLRAVHPAPGRPASAMFRTTNFTGQSVAGVLAFHAADPARCATAHGLTAATITGILSHTGVVPATPTARPRQAGPMRLTSPAITRAGQLPPSATCTGGATSPNLRWSHVPSGTRDLALLVTDPDAPGRTVSHWVLYNISPTIAEVPSGAVPSGAHEGVNSFGTTAYLPACPLPRGSIHQYVFELFASKQRLRFGHPPTDSQVRNALAGHVLATATLVATFAIGPPNPAFRHRPAGLGPRGGSLGRPPDAVR